MKVLIAGKLNVTNDFKFSRSGWSIILTGALLKIGVWLALFPITAITTGAACRSGSKQSSSFTARTKIYSIFAS